MNNTAYGTRIGDIIYSRRKELGMSVKKLSETAGISESSITNYERGKTQPHYINLQKLTKALGLSFTDVAKFIREYSAFESSELICFNSEYDITADHIETITVPYTKDSGLTALNFFVKYKSHTELYLYTSQVSAGDKIIAKEANGMYFIKYATEENLSKAVAKCIDENYIPQCEIHIFSKEIMYKNK